jgi:hypothetical protein
MSENSEKWRGGFEDFTNPNGGVSIFDIPNDWLNFEYRKTQRKDVLKDTLVWAMGADLIEGFSEMDDSLFDQIVIPVKLSELAKESAFEGRREIVTAWVAGLSERGIQVKLFAKSDTEGQFRVMDFRIKRPDRNNYSTFIAESGRWNYGVIAEWQDSLPEVILDAVRS